MKKIAVLFYGLAIVFTSLGRVPTASAAGAATMWLSPQNITVASGSTFSVAVTINPNAETLDTARANISFPPSLLQVVSFELGTQFPSAAPGNSYNNSTGLITQGAFKYGDRVSASGTFGTITFKAISGGTATVNVLADSKLIHDGEERINLSSLGVSTISITGEVTAPTVVTVPAGASAEQTALIYFGALVGRLPSSALDWEALHCMAYDDCYPGVANQDLNRERRALEIFTQKYARLPNTTIEWNTLHAIAYTNIVVDWEAEGAAPVAEPEPTPEPEPAPSTGTSGASAEQTALIYFGALVGRLPSSALDWEALHCMAYDDCYPGRDLGNLSREQRALEIFTQKYARLPDTQIEWNTLHAIAYTNIVIDWDVEVSPTPEPEPEPEPTPAPSEDKSLEQQALVYFGALAGRLPSSGPEWEALHCMAYDTCYPGRENGNIEREQQALVLFGEKYARMPSTSIEWNTLHAIAYTNVFVNWDAVVAPEPTPEPEPEEPSAEQIAIGIFGQLTGRLPSSSEDWTAVHIITDGYTGDRDAAAEADALGTFTSTFGYLPSTSQDWNVIAAIAYSGAF
jgi:hypothetical protein